MEPHNIKVLGAVNFIYDSSDTVSSRISIGSLEIAPHPPGAAGVDVVKNGTSQSIYFDAFHSTTTPILTPGHIKFAANAIVPSVPNPLIVRLFLGQSVTIHAKLATQPTGEPNGTLTLLGLIDIDWPAGEFVAHDGTRHQFASAYNITGKANTWTVDFEFMIRPISDDRTIEVSVWVGDVLLTRFVDTRLQQYAEPPIFHDIVGEGDVEHIGAPGLIVGGISQLVLTSGGLPGYNYGPVSFLKMSLDETVREDGWRGSDRPIVNILNSSQMSDDSYVSSGIQESTMTHISPGIDSELYIPAMVDLLVLSSDAVDATFVKQVNGTVVANLIFPNVPDSVLPMTEINSPDATGYDISQPVEVTHIRTTREIL